jgi:hypothetical protein
VKRDHNGQVTFSLCSEGGISLVAQSKGMAGALGYLQPSKSYATGEGHSKSPNLWWRKNYRRVEKQNLLK